MAPLNDDFVILPKFHLKVIITITWRFLISNSSVWMMIVENHYFNPASTAEMAEIKQGGFVGKSWDEMGHET